MRGLTAGIVAVVLSTGLAGGVAWGEQKHMRNALDHLQKAKEQLQQSKGDKGGHRANAMELIDKAINQVQKGIEYADEKD
jgi:hypothetical protein